MLSKDGVPPATHLTAAALRQHILQGVLRQGQPLREVAMAEQLQVSRNTLRGAFLLLSAERLVEILPYHGARVARVTPDDVTDIFIARRTLELGAIEKVGSVDAAALRPLADAVEITTTAARHEDWRAAGTGSLRFHQAIVGLLGSTYLDELFLTLSARLRLVFPFAADEREFQRPWVSRDQILLDLARAGRVAAATAELADYLSDSEAKISAIVAGTPQQDVAPARSARTKPVPAPADNTAMTLGGNQ